MTTTFYIDTNRKNCSHKNKSAGEENNEWIYKLNNTLQLPAGTEIAIQDSFIHKQGISGATIEITEDIEEEMFYTFYLSDNPHFVPQTSTKFDTRSNNTVTGGKAFTPSFVPHGPLEDNLVVSWDDWNNGLPFKDNGGAIANVPGTGAEINTNRIIGSGGAVSNNGFYYGQPTCSQRVVMFEDDGENNTRLTSGQFGVISDPFLMGYTEQPMCAIYVDGDDTYTTQPGDLTFGDQIGADPEIQELNLADPRFKPFTKSVKILIPKGVYSIGEIADLVESQINGKYVNIANDDYYTDTAIAEQNNNNFDGNLESNVYARAEAFDRFGGFDNVDNSIIAGNPPDELLDYDPINSATWQDVSTRLFAVYNQGLDPGDYNFLNSPALESARRWREYNPTGMFQMGMAGFNDRYSIPYYPPNNTLDIQYTDDGGTQQTIAVPRYMLAYNKRRRGRAQGNDPAPAQGGGLEIRNASFMKGRAPRLPSKQHLFYIPVHYFNQLIKMWKYNDIGDPGGLYPGGQSADVNSYLNHTGNWTVNSRRLFRYSFQQRVSAYGASNANSTNDDDGTNSNFIGLHMKVKTNSFPDVLQPKTAIDNPQAHIAVSPAQFNYDIMANGYYVGTPDFQFSYDEDNSAFTIKGLHQQPRVPSSDIVGNPMANEGQTTAYLKRTAKVVLDVFDEPGRTQSRISSFGPPSGYTPEQQAYVDRFAKAGGAEEFRKRVKNVLNANEDRVGGIAVYNWAMNTAKKYGDINPATYTNTDYLNRPFKVYDERYTYLWKFQDFFSTEEKAKEAWSKTLWSKLGFSYDNLQNDASWEKANYYDIPINKYSPTQGTTSGTHPTQNQQNTYYEEKNKMYFRDDDFILYGKTTKQELGISSGPSISTTFNNANYEYTPSKSQNLPPKDPKDTSPNTLHTIIRSYDNNNVVTPYFAKESTVIGNYWSEINDDNQYQTNNNLVSGYGLLHTTPQLPGRYYGITDGKQEAAFPNAFNTTSQYDNSMVHFKTRIPVMTDSKSILATGLPQLSQQGYYIITSDIVDGYRDDVKQGAPIPLLGIVPISNLSNQDFITTKNDIIHTLQQPKVLNSIKIKILNPDLTAPRLLQNSSVVLRVTMPLPSSTPATPEQTDKKEVKTKTNQPSPEDKKTTSGGPRGVRAIPRK